MSEHRKEIEWKRIRNANRFCPLRYQVTDKDLNIKYTKKTTINREQTYITKPTDTLTLQGLSIQESDILPEAPVMGKLVELQTRGRSPVRQDPCRRAHTSGGERHRHGTFEESPHSPYNEFDIKDSIRPFAPKNTLFTANADFVKTGDISQKPYAREHTAFHDLRTSPMMRRSKTWAPDVSKSMIQRTDYDSPFTRSRSSTPQMIYTPERTFAKRDKVAATPLSRLQQLALPKFPGLSNVCSLRRPRSMMELRDLDLEDYETIREAEKTANKWHWALKY